MQKSVHTIRIMMLSQHPSVTPWPPFLPSLFALDYSLNQFEDALFVVVDQERPWGG